MYCLREPSPEEDSQTRMCINDWKNVQEIEKVGQEMKGSRSLVSSIYHGHNEENKQETSHGGKLCSLLQVSTVDSVDHISEMSSTGERELKCLYPPPHSLVIG